MKDKNKDLTKENTKKVNNNQANEQIVAILKEIKILLVAVVVLLVFICVVTLVTNKKIVSTYSGGPGNTGGNNGGNNQDEIEYDVSSFIEVNADELLELYDKEGYYLIYTGRSTCGYCVMYVPVLKEIQEKYDIDVYYLDITKVTQDDYDKLTKVENLLTENFGTTPLTMVYKDGKYVDGTVGYVEASVLEELLNKTGMISKEE